MVTNYRDILKSFCLRGIFGIPLFLFGVVMLFKGDPRGILLIIIGALIMAFPLASLLAEPAGRLFYPGRRFSGPLPMYGIPEGDRKKGLYEESIAGFEEIARKYPKEVKPYIEMIDIAIRDLKDPERAEEIYHRGMSSLKSAESQNILTAMYNAVKTRLDVIPSN